MHRSLTNQYNCFRKDPTAVIQLMIVGQQGSELQGHDLYRLVDWTAGTHQVVYVSLGHWNMFGL